jgi:hypothetical protein
VEKPENASMSEPFFVPVSDATMDELLAEAQIPYACALCPNPIHKVPKVAYRKRVMVNMVGPERKSFL